MPFPLTIAPSHGGPRPHLTHPSLDPPESITETASQSIQPFLHRSRQSVAILYNGPPIPLSLKITPPHRQIHGSLGPSEPTIQTASRSIQPFFANMTVECPYTLQLDAPSSVKVAPSHGGSAPPSNTWFPGPTRVHNSNGILIGPAVCAGLTSVPDRQTDRQGKRGGHICVIWRIRLRRRCGLM